MHKPQGLRPRNVTATDEERAAILRAAPPHLKLWLLLCSDLAMRSGTAARIAPRNYDPKERTFQFTTKMGEHLTLPATEEISRALALCDHECPDPYVRQVWRREAKGRGRRPEPNGDPSPLSKQFAQFRRALGITRKLTPHDLRRTTAVHLYEQTGDARDVQALLGHRTLQSTIWYLDHDLRPVKRSLLELIKRPEWRKEQTA